ncbi:signal recognition particle receptor alpha subunit [Histomonas meleagridis]|uniref:signal recognition particle receptor alpha subunit n=1 Tax=Histomonas meleagridis TaxID=135588 RepID=UPI0035593B6B|nr:signal recognition particle receptor alpha subunit [Histomonas meleagridis]KAH0797647.1 signal recognition particle receptor alpha subunit [Histomonas meleagridis]
MQKEKQNVFELFVFESGGLVLWPKDCETSRKTTSVVNEYVQKQILEGHSTEATFKKDQTFVIAKHSPDSNMHFCITLPFQISQHTQYLPQMLDEFIEEFEHQFAPIIEKSDQIMLVPDLFAPFSEESILKRFQGVTSTAPKKPTPNVSESFTSISTMPKTPKVNNKNDRKSTPPRSNSPSKSDRPRFNQKKDTSEVEALSTVIRQKRDEESVEVKQYDLDDFEGVFSPSRTNASKVAGLFRNIIGEKTLTEDNLNPILTEFEQYLVNKNVATHIASELTKAVGQKLLGTRCGTFSSIKTIVTNSLRESIERILTPHRSIDIIRDIQNSRAKGVPYVMAFVGVNGVGKSTSLSKVAYLFKLHGFKVLISACDTFRSGAVDQLEVHSKRLQIELFQRGGGKRDPVPVARDSIAYAKENNFDVVLIDTAGRMQNDTNLMKQIARLINEVKPDMTVFVAEALVGNNGSDQIQQFDKTLKMHNGGENAKGIDGIILTKFDTVDDKVGAALTLVYETGHPIVYLGVGEQYHHLRRMKPEFVVSTLLNGF